MTQKIIIETLPTLLDYSTLEISRILGKINSVSRYSDSLFFIDSDNLTHDLVMLTLFSETITKFYLFLGSWDITSENDLYNSALEVQWSELIPEGASFAVRPVVQDKKQISVIGKHVGQAVIDSYYKDTKRRLRVNLSNPDIEVFAWLQDNKLSLGLDLCGDRLNNDQEILARVTLLSTKWNEKSNFGEIIYSGISTSALRFATRSAHRTKLKSRRFIVLPFIDRETILELARRNWRINIDAKINCYELEGRINLIKQIDPEVRKIAIHGIEELANSDDEYFASNLLLAIEKKNEQLALVEKIFNSLRNNDNWRALTILAREDVLNQIQLNINIERIENSIIFKGIRSRMVTYIR